jgi:hypothetical protein
VRRRVRSRACRPDGARPFRLVLGSAGGGEQGQVERPAADIAAVHVQGTPRVAGGNAGLAQVAEALGHPGCQVGLVEIGQPGGVVVTGGAVEGVEACGKLPGDLREHLLLGGDYNVIGRTHRPLHPGFLPFEFGLLEGLRERGLVGAYEHVAQGEQAHSWIGRTGDGYRYDYLHVGLGLAGLIGTSSYLHETRQLSLTDHAAMTLTLHADAAPLETGDPADTEVADGALTLF